MADKPEEIIIIEDSDAAQYDTTTEDLQSIVEQEEAKRKKIILFGGISIIVVLLIAVIAILFALKASKKHENIKINLDNAKLHATPKKSITPSKLENMIAKANYLYQSGAKQKALVLYEKIASYSEAISQYNLGVAQLKQKQYKLALKSFQNAISNNEKRCVSAINAAVCSLHLKKESDFKYYIDLAYAYLPYEINSPLYSYYYTLISYYQKNYLNALSSLKNSTSNEYATTQEHLSAKINALYENDYDAIDALEKINDEQNDFALALLYARVGDFSLALNHINNTIKQEKEPVRAPLVLSFINIKAGHLTQAAQTLKAVTNKYPNEVYKYYPIKVELKKALFDPQKAQKLYRKELIESKNIIYQKIFYFSPYKIFNANQTISYIRKGNANIYIDNVQTAQKYLKKSASSSSVNIGIVKAIKDALSFKIRQANEELQKLAKIEPKHSILQYDLALTYAQLGDMNKAHEHFLRSYYLDAKNYLSGIYAVMTAQLLDKKYYKLKSIIKDSLALEKESEELDLYKTLIHFSEGSYISAVDWLDKDYKQRPLYLIMNIVLATKLHKPEVAKKAAKKLLLLKPKEILPNIIYMDTEYADLKSSQYAQKVLAYLTTHSFDLQDLYYGPFITRYLYIQDNLLTGRLYYLKEQLQHKLTTTQGDTRDIESALALVLLYNKNFEESYTLYNHLIDTLKVRDTHTLYLGAVASTAAKHHENAIALLELAKLKNGSFYESRFALALLYMEIKDNNGAAIQLQHIPEDGFQSHYFDFTIDTDKLLFEKQHPKAEPLS